MSALRRFLGDRRGASAVEFALLAGPFLLLMLGSVEFGRAIWSRHVIQEVAIAGARCIAVPQPACAAGGEYDQTRSIDFILDAAGAKGVTLSKPEVVVDRDTTCFGTSGFSRVTISYEFVTALPGFLSTLASGPQMGANSCFPTQGTGS
jgi:Flp pilus assembly protein TadG